MDDQVTNSFSCQLNRYLFLYIYVPTSVVIFVSELGWESKDFY